MFSKCVLWLGLLPVVGLSNPITVTIQAPTASGTLIGAATKTFSGQMAIKVFTDTLAVGANGQSLVGGRVTVQIGTGPTAINVNVDTGVIVLIGQGEVSFGFVVPGHNSVLFSISDTGLGSVTLHGSFTASGTTTTVAPVSVVTDQGVLTIATVPNATLAVAQVSSAPVKEIVIPQTGVVATPLGGVELTSGQAAIALYNALLITDPLGIDSPLVLTNAALSGVASAIDRGLANDALVAGGHILNDFDDPDNVTPVPIGASTGLALAQGPYSNLVMEELGNQTSLWAVKYSALSGAFSQTQLGPLPVTLGPGTADVLAYGGNGAVFYSAGGPAPGSFQIGVPNSQAETAGSRPQVTSSQQQVTGMDWTPFGLAITTQTPVGSSGAYSGNIGLFTSGAFTAFPIDLGASGSGGGSPPLPVSPGYFGCGYVSFLEGPSGSEPGNVYWYNIGTQQTSLLAAAASIPGASSLFLAGPMIGVAQPNLANTAVSFLEPIFNGACWDSFVGAQSPATGRSGGIVMGPDGATWYAAPLSNGIGRVTGNGAADSFATLTAGSGPLGIAIGSDGNYWITETAANQIQQTTALGVSTEFGGLSAGSAPANIVAGADGALWFNESGSGKMGRITTAGAVTEFAANAANSVAAGPDAAVWYTEAGTAKIGRIATSGAVTECTLNHVATQIAGGPDGAMWFTEAAANQIGRVTTDGNCTVSEYSTGLTANAGLDAITLGPDGALWFTEDNARQLGRIDPVFQSIVEYPLPAGLSSTAFSGIAIGIEGGVWITGNAGEVVRDMLPAGAVGSQVTVGTISAGQSYTFDGMAFTSAQTFSVPLGTNHTVAVTLPPTSASTRFSFLGWSDGATTLSETIGGPAPPSMHIANVTTQYLLSTAASPAAGGSVTATPSSADGFYNAGTSVAIVANANPGYQFVNWTGSVASAGSASTTVTMSGPISVTANFVAVTPVTVQTSPEGLQFSIDGGTAQKAPLTVNLTQETHTIAVSTVQAGPVGTPAGTQYVFTGWSDGATAASDTVTVGTTAATYTASFKTQYQLTIAALPAAGGTVTPASGAYFDAGTVVAISAAANAGYTFNGWSGAVASAATAATTVTMSAAENITANFLSLTAITIQTSPTGLQFNIDGGPSQTAPQMLSLSQGNYTIAVATPQAGPGGTPAGTQYVFTGWSDGGAASHSIAVGGSAATYTASFGVQYLLTTTVAPAGSGSVTASPSSSGYYNAGTNVQLTASANASYQFNNWTGDLSGSANPQSIAMNTAHSVTANFVIPPCSINVTSATSLPATGTSTVETCPDAGQPNCGVTPEAPMSFTVTPSAACGAWTATSSNPGVLQITSGGVPSGPSSGAGTVGFTLLNNTHTGPQSYTITVASGSASATYSVTEAGSGDNQTYREVYALYEQFLGRDPDPAGFAFWTGSGLAGLGQMADSFLTSPEAFNSDFAVMAAYQAATGAPPAYAQFAAAVASVRAGAQTVPGLFNALIGSSFTAANLYQNLLNRATASGDSACIASGLAQCFQTIIGYPAPAATNPIGATNNEFQSTGTFNTTLAADHTNALYVQMIYYVTLSRDPDPAGYAFWLGIANSGGPGLLFQGSTGFGTRIQIMGPGTPGQGFIGSAEFQGLFAN